MAERSYIAAKMRRFVVLHYHIMKNAGSTLAAVLEREFAGSFLDLDSDCPNGLVTATELLDYLEAHPGVAALSSHQIRFPSIQSDTIVPFELCLIRHPLDRLESLYTYSLSHDDSTVISNLARRTELRGFISELVDGFPHFACNAQVTLIANGSRFTRPPDEDDLQRAIATIRKISLPGVVCRFDESMVTAEYFLRPAFPTLQLHYRIENATRPAARSMEEREHHLRQALGEDLFRELGILNELDLQLVRAAENELDRRIALIPSFAARLEAFKARCSTPPASAP
jgi:hypothetical protein